MHSIFGLQEGRGSPKIAVLDTIHGASTIARELLEQGMDAEALEVYHHAPSIAGFDIVVAPVHLDPRNPALASARSLGKRVVTHHRAVGALLQRQLGQGLKVFEVTGTHSKTSTSLLLSTMLSTRGSVVSHTTRGLEVWSDGRSRLVSRKMSITPGNVIPAMAEARSRGADFLVCEVSLGGTGIADWGVLTSLSGDYRIAGGTMWASTAKLQLLSLARDGSRVLANTDAQVSPDISFGAGGQVRAEPDRIAFGREEQRLSLGGDLDFPAYQIAISGAAAAARSAGVPLEEIASVLEGFDGLDGRMKLERRGDLTILDCSNSGLKVRDVRRALDRTSGGRLGVVVGEESERVCEGMEVRSLVDLLRQRRDEMALLVLVGERLWPWAEELRAQRAGDLASGQQIAAGFGLDRLLLCVKCFR